MSLYLGDKPIANDGSHRLTGEIGDMGFAPLGIDESLNLRRYMNGQVISQTQFEAFTNKVKSAVALFPNLGTTETNWQAEKAQSKFGQVGKFVIDDTAGTIRLPAVVNAQGLLGLSGIGNLVNESLPNITGNSGALIPRSTSGSPTGAVKNTGSVVANMASGNNIGSIGLGFDASLSSSTYQDNAPVQQEAVQYPYYIQVATGIEETLPAIREYQVNNSDYFGKSMYSNIAPDNASWLASNGQYNARSVYPDYYDWLNSKIGQVITANGGKVVLSTDTYTDYDFVVNQTDQTFRLPLLNGSEDVPDYEHQIDNVITGTINSTGQTYTAPNNGLFYQQVNIASGNSVSIIVNNIGQYNFYNNDSNYATGSSVEVRKGDIIKLLVGYGSGTGTIENCHFTPFKGNGTLYYYVGDTVQDASLINAGAVLNEIANLKARRYITETYENGTSWYRVYSDGWVEQGGIVVTGSSPYTVNLLKR